MIRTARAARTVCARATAINMYSTKVSSAARAVEGAARQYAEILPLRATCARRAGLRNFNTSSPEEGNGERTAQHAWERSCYFNIDYKVDENETVYNAVRHMSAYNVGCLVVTTDGQVSGIITERDYVCKIALLGKESKKTKVKEICTTGSNMVAAKRSDSIETCVKKMLDADIRHLPVIDDCTGEVFGLISVKDLVKEYTKERDDLLCKMIGVPLSSSPGRDQHD